MTSKSRAKTQSQDNPESKQPTQKKSSRSSKKQSISRILKHGRGKNAALNEKIQRNAFYCASIAVADILWSIVLCCSLLFGSQYYRLSNCAKSVAVLLILLSPIAQQVTLFGIWIRNVYILWFRQFFSVFTVVYNIILASVFIYVISDPRFRIEHEGAKHVISQHLFYVSPGEDLYIVFPWTGEVLALFTVVTLVTVIVNILYLRIYCTFLSLLVKKKGRRSSKEILQQYEGKKAFLDREPSGRSWKPPAHHKRKRRRSSSLRQLAKSENPLLAGIAGLAGIHPLDRTMYSERTRTAYSERTQLNTSVQPSDRRDSNKAREDKSDDSDASPRQVFRDMPSKHVIVGTRRAREENSSDSEVVVSQSSFRIPFKHGKRQLFSGSDSSCNRDSQSQSRKQSSTMTDHTMDSRFASKTVIPAKKGGTQGRVDETTVGLATTQRSAPQLDTTKPSGKNEPSLRTVASKGRKGSLSTVATSQSTSKRAKRL